MITKEKNNIESLVDYIWAAMPIGEIDSEEDLKKWADGDDSVLKEKK